MTQSGSDFLSAFEQEEVAGGGVACIGGEYIAADDAQISIRDNGLANSDLTMDVAAVWDGAFFRLDDHLDRLFRGCDRLRLTPLPSREQVREMMFEMVRRAGLRSAYVFAMVTRGAPVTGKERDIRELTPALYGYALPYQWILPPDQLEVGVDVMIPRGVFRIPPGAVDPTVKNFHRGDFVRGQLEVYDRGGTYAVLTDADGLLTEGDGFNLFALVDGTLHTPADGVLFGITRQVALEIAAEEGIPTEVGPVSVELAKRAEEIFMTSTAGGIMAVSALDGEPVGSGREGPATRLIRDRYWELHYDPRYIDPVDYPEAAE